MSRERALKVVLVVVGLIFFGLVYPLTMFVRQEPALAMMLSLYVTLGIFLLLAARNPWCMIAQPCLSFNGSSVNKAGVTHWGRRVPSNQGSCVFPALAKGTLQALLGLLQLAR